MMIDLSRLQTALKRYKEDITDYNEKISLQQSEILKDQAWIHKLEAEIEEYKEAMTEKVEIIKDYQSKIFGAQEAIVALNEIVE
jgi:chromosome segregation ATPase